MKKIIVVVLVSSVFLIMCWGIGTFIHSNKIIQVNNTEESINNENGDNTNDTLLGNCDLNRIEFENSEKTDDNPWGFTAGLVDTESSGKCIFLTPNTAVKLCDFSEDLDLNEKGPILKFMIHPWVSEESDGAGIDIWYFDEKGELLSQETINIDNSNVWHEHIINCSSDRLNYIKILCNNGNNNDDRADWVIIK